MPRFEAAGALVLLSSSALRDVLATCDEGGWHSNASGTVNTPLGGLEFKAISTVPRQSFTLYPVRANIVPSGVPTNALCNLAAWAFHTTTLIVLDASMMQK
jgi:hypothetical protein